MDTTIIVAMVGAIATILSPVIVLLIKNYLDDRKNPKAPKERKMALVGNWKGESIQYKGAEDYIKKSSVEASIKISVNNINGSVNISYIGEGDKYNMFANLSNGSFDGNILRIDYSNKKYHILQNGVLYFELMPDGITLNGGFVGYGYKSKKVVFGEISLNKIE